jgi:flagellar hook-associated protein 3 FlgL
MDLRVSSQTIADQAIANATQQAASVAQLQEQASTGNTIQQPSDNPEGEVTLLAAQELNQQLGTYLTNIKSAQITLGASTTALQNTSSILSQANSLAEQANNSTDSSTTLQAIASQVNDLLGQLVSAANTQSGNQYLFAGTASTTKPFVVTSTNSQGQAETIAYAGNDQQGQAVIGNQQTVTTLYPGNSVFQSQGSQTGATDAFQTLINLRDTLENSSGASTTQLAQSLSGIITNLTSAQTGTENALGEIGATAQTLTTQSTQVQQAQLAAQQQISNVGSADMSTVLVNLQQQQNLLEATLYSATQIMNVSLLNFLQ